MAAFEGPQFIKNQGLGLSNPSEDNIYGLVAGGVVTTDYPTLGEIVKLIQPEDAEAIGIDAAYDANNEILVHHHIKEFFKYSPDGTLFLKLVAQGTSLEDMCDTTKDHLKGLLMDTVIVDRKIKRAGVVLNPVVLEGGITEITITDGGTLYDVADTFDIGTGTGGTGFAATPIIDSGTGEVTGYTITDPGSGYTVAPTIAMTTSTGSGAVLTAVIDQTYGETYTSGYDADVNAAVAKAQDIVNELAAQEIRIDNIVIEGRMQDGADLNTLHDFSAETSPAVNVVCAADPAVQAMSTSYRNYAAVGSVLGMYNVRKVSENIGSVDIEKKPAGKRSGESYPLTDKATGNWLSANLSSGKVVTEMTPADQSALEEKHVIFAGSYEGYPGVYFNDSLTCIQRSDDFSTGENNATWNKAVRAVRQALLPKMKATVKVDTSTGFLQPAVTKALEQRAFKAVSSMLANGEASGVIVYINPEQDILSGGSLVFKLSIVPVGVLRAITGEAQLSNPFNS